VFDIVEDFGHGGAVTVEHLKRRFCTTTKPRRWARFVRPSDVRICGWPAFSSQELPG
jgi:hypothetical protein